MTIFVSSVLNTSSQHMSIIKYILDVSLTSSNVLNDISHIYRGHAETVQTVVLKLAWKLSMLVLDYQHV